MQDALLEQIESFAGSKRNELVLRLVSFVSCDTLLFLAESEQAEQRLLEVNELLLADFQMCEGVIALPKNEQEGQKVANFLRASDDFKLGLIYLTATTLRSVLLGILFAERRLDAEEAFKLAFYEELLQQKIWGQTEDVSAKHKSIMNDLKAWEQQRNERTISKN